MAQLGKCSSVQPGIVNDAVCFTIDLEDTGGAGITVWEEIDTNFLINGTIMIENNGIAGSPSAALSVNGTAVGGFVVQPGEARAVTLDGLESIEVIGDGTGTALVKISFSVNYRF